MHWSKEEKTPHRSWFYEKNIFFSSSSSSFFTNLVTIRWMVFSVRSVSAIHAIIQTLSYLKTIKIAIKTVFFFVFFLFSLAFRFIEFRFLFYFTVVYIFTLRCICSAVKTWAEYIIWFRQNVTLHVSKCTTASTTVYIQNEGIEPPTEIVEQNARNCTE